MSATPKKPITTKDLFKIKEKMFNMKVTVKYPTGIDLGLLKELTVDTLERVKKTNVSIGDRSNYKIISIAGETVALGTTGLKSDEKVLHDAVDFEKLYVHTLLKGKEEALKEILIRMFTLSGGVARKDILPPKDDDSFDMVILSLQHRLELLQQEVVDSDGESMDAREKLNHFYRLKRLIESLMKQRSAGKRMDYAPVSSESGKPPEKGEEKLEIDQAEAMRLLQLFGYVLLQAQYQLPGYTFPFSTRQMVQNVQKVAINQGAFTEDLKKGSMTIHPAIQDVLDPTAKEKAFEARLIQSAQGVLEDLIEMIADEEIKERLAPLVSPDSPPKDINTLVKGVTDILGKVASDRERLAQSIKPLMDAKADCDGKMEALQQELEKAKAEVAAAEGEASSEAASSTSSVEVEALKNTVKRLQEEKAALQKDSLTLKVEIQKRQTAEAQLDKAVEYLKKLGAKVQEHEKTIQDKDALLKQLQAKEGELDTLQEKINKIEALEIQSRKDQQTLQKLQKDLSLASKQKIALEQQLEGYAALQRKLELSVRLAPTLNLKGKSELEKFSARIQTLLDTRNTESNRTSTTTSSSNEEDGKSDDLSTVSETLIPLDTIFPEDEYFIPSILELKANFVSDYCTFLQTLDDLYSNFFSSDEDTMIEKRLNNVLNTLYGKILPAREEPITGEFRNAPAGIAEALQHLLVFAIEQHRSSFMEKNAAFYKQLGEILNPIQVEFQEQITTTITEKGIDTEDLEAFDEVVATKGVNSYALVLFLYILSLRDWVNCLDGNLAKPIECPAIPESLKRPEMKKWCRVVAVV